MTIYYIVNYTKYYYKKNLKNGSYTIQPTLNPQRVFSKIFVLKDSWFENLNGIQVFNHADYKHFKKFLKYINNVCFIYWFFGMTNSTSYLHVTLDMEFELKHTTTNRSFDKLDKSVFMYIECLTQD